MKICPQCKLRYPADATQCFVDRSPLEAEPDPLIGTLLGGTYRIEGVLGEGGMATVYRARQTLQDRPVAVKVFRKDLAKDEKLRERFRREATSTSRLAHPNIIQIMDSGDLSVGPKETTPYLVMEMLVGESLESLIGKGRLPLARGVDIMLQVLNGLSRAHDFQVIHRDLKPDNLFVCQTQEGGDLVKILDFGIARSMSDSNRLTSSGELFGTPQYMAPERITSIDAGPSADLYAIGVITYEILTGQLPWDAQDISQWLLAHMKEPPTPPRKYLPEMPPALENLILRLLEKDPSKRPVDARAVMKEMQAIADALPKPRGAVKPPATMMATMVSPEAPRPRAAGTLAPATLEKWERRVLLFEQMVQRAFPGGARPDYAALLQRVRENFSAMTELRKRTVGEQARLEAGANAARETQGRFGHAMDALGEDLSRVRQEVQRAKEYQRGLGGATPQAQAAFAQAHQRVAAAAPVPSADLAGLYRAALEALERALGDAGGEQARVAAYIQTKERETADIEFQILELRNALARVSQQAEQERGALQRTVEQLSAQIAGHEQQLIADASSLANGLRGNPALAELFRQLESAGA